MKDLDQRKSTDDNNNNPSTVSTEARIPPPLSPRPPL
eukprot:CAMPEP_0170887480 /NCGR_PEP_ID=MMETSP0734-20130129/37634_1 /TAXON_ID=186038 /ORGANISM="Fragilariopsis kerguelensis, Strain L26-C5" /LENGTH=36 /DNA_ID= /DNA_START= /DNA_END= /DNA_ORIENTATION=